MILNTEEIPVTRNFFIFPGSGTIPGFVSTTIPKPKIKQNNTTTTTKQKQKTKLYTLQKLKWRFQQTIKLGEYHYCVANLDEVTKDQILVSHKPSHNNLNNCISSSILYIEYFNKTQRQ